MRSAARPSENPNIDPLRLDSVAKRDSTGKMPTSASFELEPEGDSHGSDDERLASIIAFMKPAQTGVEDNAHRPIATPKVSTVLL